MRTLLVVTVTLLSFAARAQEPEAEARADAPAPSLELSLKAGGHFPQLTNALGTSFDVIFKVGYAPFGTRQLQLFADVGYSQPSHVLSADDPRLGADGAAYTSTLTVQDLATTFGAAWFFLPPSESLAPYAGAGLRIHFLKATVDGAAGEAFGHYQETDTRVGGVAFGGVGYRLGPGRILGELAFGYAPVDQRVTGTTNIGALSVLLGYGLML